MDRFLFFSAPLAGHLDFGGYLRTAEYLTHHGCQVIWATGPQVAGIVEKAGIPYVDAWAMNWSPQPVTTGSTSTTNALVQRIRRSLTLWLDETQAINAARRMLRVAKDLKPHVIVAESCTPVAAVVAEVLDIPLAVVGYPYGAIRQIPDHSEFQLILEEYSSKWNKFRASFGLHPIPPHGNRWQYFISPYLHITFFPRWWWYSEEDPSPPQARYLGGTALLGSDRGILFNKLNQMFAGRKIVLITLGTLYDEDFEFFQVAIQSVVSDLGLSCIVTGPTKYRERISIPHDYVYWVDWLDYNVLFPCLSAIIHHGGMGTTHAAILHGLPQLVVPHAADQPYHAEQVKRFGLGLKLHPDEVTVKRMTEALSDILCSRDFLNNTLGAKLEFSKLGGVEAAASLLRQLARGELEPVSEASVPDLPLACYDYPV